MIMKKLFLVPLVLFAVVGPIHAASQSELPFINNGWSVDSSSTGLSYDISNQTLSWGVNGDKDPSSLSFAFNDIHNDLPVQGGTKTMDVGSFSYYNGKMPGPGSNPTLSATLNLTIGDEMYVDLLVLNTFSKRGDKTDGDMYDMISFEKLPKDSYSFECDKQKYLLSLIGIGDNGNLSFQCDEGKTLNLALKATVTNVTSSVPIPASALLLGSGLLGLLGFRRRQMV